MLTRADALIERPAKERSRRAEAKRNSCVFAKACIGPRNTSNTRKAKQVAHEPLTEKQDTCQPRL